MNLKPLIYLGGMAVVLGSSLGPVQAQAVDPNILRQALPRAAGPGGSGHFKLPNAPASLPALVTGINVRHCGSTQWYTDNTYHFTIINNTEGDSWYFYSNSVVELMGAAEAKALCIIGHAYYTYYDPNHGPFQIYSMQGPMGP